MSNENDLSYWREKIDQNDREIVKLILDRAKFVHKIGEIKRDQVTPIFRPDREKQVYENVRKAAVDLYGNRPPMPLKLLEAIYREIISGSVAIEGGLGVAFLGPPGSFSHIATRFRFGSAVRAFPVETISDVFDEVESGREVSYGVVPVDNTTEGSVGATLEKFLISDLKIYAEQYVRINHNLLFHKEVPVESIKKLYTIKIVREQCREWISHHLKHVEIVDAPSTSAAASMASQRKDGAAIASDLAAETYALKFIARNIQDHAANITRFIVLAKEQCLPTGDDKTSILFAFRDRPGALYELLKPLHQAGVNMTRIESRATRRSYGDYNFFVDFLGHAKDEKIEKILQEVEKSTSYLKILGSYPRADLP